ncbi:MAG TPA: tetratricopeptide repeat protein, partial [Gemmataceae bacterium]|nr:tetratricopeptide repeat protein [Gemmataceae bacterium]
RLLAARAARRAGAYDEAREHLGACQRLRQPPPDEVVLEWALLRAAMGDLKEVEEYLQARALKEPAAAPLIWEALAEGCTRMYRVMDALACLDRWLTLDPDNVQAHVLRGNVWRHGGATERAREEYQRALELDPARDDAREWLARCQVRLGRYAEALANLEELQKRRPGDPGLLVEMARCQHDLNRRDEARQTLDAVLADHPDHPAALRERGRMALVGGDPAEAEQLLARAARADPYNYQTNWNYYLALQKQGKTAAAEAQKAVAEKLKDRIERMGEIRQRQMSARPHDPALHCEMGTLLMELGQQELAVRWLLSALNQDPDYGPAHAALADYYRRQGDTEKADYHRRQAQAAPAPKKAP